MLGNGGKRSNESLLPLAQAAMEVESDTDGSWLEEDIQSGGSNFLN